MNDEYYMDLAFLEAKKAEDIDEVPVGAVIVDNNKDVIGYGYNCPISSNDPTSHAEINAIRMASKVSGNYRLINTTLYVTIEPCIMCMGAIIHARIKRVVFGAKDLKWGAAGSLYNIAEDKLLNHQPEITSGISKEKIKQLIKGFFKNKRSK
ncbi:MAG: tRNA adenosine(34) deaminase TadA [Deltaproteobacteria bacterium]|nr:tRNA adenosine(34) deaminase TadA [Deltaproteobacteria bacterium]